MHYFGGGIGHLRQGFLQEVTCDMDVDSGPEDGMCQPHVGDSLDAHPKTLELLVEGSDQAEGEADIDEYPSSSDSGSDFYSDANGSNHNSDDDDLGLGDGESSDNDNNSYVPF